jgi:hypothetical protein
VTPLASADLAHPRAPAYVKVEVYRVEQHYNATTNVTTWQSYFNLTYRLSPDDPDNHTVCPCPYAYELYRSNTSGNGTFHTATLTWGAIPNAPEYAYVLLSDGDTIPVSYTPSQIKMWLRANYTVTGELSVKSCEVYPDLRVNRSVYECGSMNGITVGDPSFPFLDVTGLIDDSGLAAGFVYSFLGLGFVFGLTVVGFLGAKAVGGIVGASLGFLFIAILGLMPLWILVLMFLGLVGLGVMMITRGGASS